MAPLGARSWHLHAAGTAECHGDSTCLASTGRDEPDLVGGVQGPEGQRKSDRRRFRRVPYRDHRRVLLVDARVLRKQRRAVPVRTEAEQHQIEMRNVIIALIW